MATSSEFSVGQLLHKAAQQMWLDFDRATSVTHPGEKGRAREDAVCRFLRDYLPGRFKVDTGFVVDASGKASRQMDVVIYDAASSPVFKISDTVRVFPVESVAAVVQVKSVLDNPALDDAVENLRSAVVLDRLAGKQYYAAPGGVMTSLPGLDTQALDLTEVSIEPILSAVFAFEGGSIDRLASRLREHNNSCELRERIPLVCVLGGGIISYALLDVCAPFNAYDPQARLAFSTNMAKELTLHIFYAMLAYGIARKVPIALSYRSYAGLEPIPLNFAE